MERLSKVGFIGLGNVGRPMAVCLLKAGFTLTVLDVTPEVQQTFVDFYGTHSSYSLSELGSSSDAVITMLPNEHEVSRVVLGVEGDNRDCLLGSMQKGSILVDMSSSSPTGTQALGKTLTDHGVSMIYAAVSASTPRP
jgi:3-hydroxyisobutyrate dehydrogenase-like beta-hydroxyacid dehydrogenase